VLGSGIARLGPFRTVRHLDEEVSWQNAVHNAPRRIEDIIVGCKNHYDKEESDMVDILHKVGIETSAVNEVYAALTTLEGLSGWWTGDTQGDTAVSGVLEFRFDVGSIDMKVVELRPAHIVRWQVVDGPPEWIGTTVSFELRQDGDYVVVLFRHEGWKEPVEFMHHCSTKWGVFMMSLKSLVETGKGAPAPRDVKIDNWN